MTRLILGIVLSSSMAGCLGFQPVGPLAKPAGKPAGKDLGAKDDEPAGPVTVPAVKPTPPVNWVDPTDVSADPRGSAEKLANELEADQKTIPTPSKTAEISVIKGRMK
ncbi:MAG TPA: hypothetical protein VM529_24140 [Gemmata sp.]|nr:hypothetical protein [Gemmata sp.]